MQLKTVNCLIKSTFLIFYSWWCVPFLCSERKTVILECYMILLSLKIKNINVQVFFYWFWHMKIWTSRFLSSPKFFPKWSIWNYWKQSKRYCKSSPSHQCCPIECWKCNMIIHVCLHTVAVWWVWQCKKVPINKVDPHPNFYDQRAKVLQQNIFERRNISDRSVYNKN